MKKLLLLSIVSYSLLFVFCGTKVFAQSHKPAAVVHNNEETSDVSTVLTPHSKDAIFENTASYTFEVRNTLDKPQSGKLSYIVTDQFNKKLLSDSISVNIGKESFYSHDFTIPSLKSGFYKVNFMINVTDYDDTTRRVFGIRPEEIKSSHAKPDDFDAFWNKAKKDLAKIRPQYKVTERKDLEKDKRKV